MSVPLNPSTKRPLRLIHSGAGELVRLPARSATTLQQRVRQIRVHGGNVWVSYRKEDVCLRPGETLEIKRGNGLVIAAPLGDRPAEFEVIY